MIDILIPCRNAPQVLSLTLTHLWAYLPAGLVQSVTLLDNGSTAPGMDAVLTMAARQPRTTVIRYNENVGVWCSVNRGLATTSARFVVVLTSDVLIGPWTLPALHHAATTHGLAYVGPDHRVLGLANHPAIFASGPFDVVPDYNGAMWMLEWPRMREAVGWYDPRFYVCNGDTDYVERARLAAVEQGLPTLAPHVIHGLHVCHLDKQSRRADEDALGDATMEVRDATRFREKWQATHPEIAARHPVPTVAQQVGYKGGWEAGKVGA